MTFLKTLSHTLSLPSPSLSHTLGMRMLVGGCIGHGEDLLMAMRQSSVTHPHPHSQSNPPSNPSNAKKYSVIKGETSFFGYVSHYRYQRAGGEEVEVREEEGADGGSSGSGAYSAGGVLSSAWRGLLQYPHSIHLSLKLNNRKTRANPHPNDTNGGDNNNNGHPNQPRRRKLSLQTQALYEIQHTLFTTNLLAARAMKRLTEARGCVDTGGVLARSYCGSGLALVPLPRLVDRLATQVNPPVTPLHTYIPCIYHYRSCIPLIHNLVHLFL